ncbi:hypothetical protein NQZ68_007229 [Dissostichus eleginoides]|nr:hypothetical protein NQZ68_007229 [Dissostichus eleginoides]
MQGHTRPAIKDMTPLEDKGYGWTPSRNYTCRGQVDLPRFSKTNYSTSLLLACYYKSPMRSSSYLLLLLLYVAMSSALSEVGTDSTSSGEEVCIIPETQAGSEIGSDAPGTSRTPRTPRTPRITPKRLAGWQVHRILDELYGNNIPVPYGLNHEDLFQFLLANESSGINLQSNASTGNNSAPKKGKATAKRHAVSQPVVNLPPKKQKQAVSDNNDSAILSSLLEVKTALQGMNSRILSLEQSSISAAGNVNNMSPSSAAHASTSAVIQAAPLPDNVTPLRTLGTAVPAPATGCCFLPPAAAIPDTLRNHILAVGAETATHARCAPEDFALQNQGNKHEASFDSSECSSSFQGSI